MKRKFQLMPLMMVVTAACGGSDNDNLIEARSLSIVTATNGQSAPAGAKLEQALQVVARTSDALPAPRATIRWVVAAGGGGAKVSDSLTMTDATGRAQVSFTLGSNVGSYSVRAELADRTDQSVIFTATATAPPTVTSVAPTQFTGGDTITITGQGFGTGITAEVGSAPAKTLSVTLTSVTAVVPVCLVPGTVTVSVRQGTVESNRIQASYQASSSPIALAVGEYASILPSQLNSCATFPTAGPQGAQYLVVVQSTTGTPGLTAGFTIVGDSVVQVITQPGVATVAPTPASRFHDYLRRKEEEFAALPKPPAGGGDVLGFSAAAAQAVKVGDKRDFRICGSVTCSGAADFSSVKAEAMYVGQNAIIYQDQNAPANGFLPAEFDSLGVIFDQVLYEAANQAFGSESDVDGNAHVAILLSPVVNSLTSKTQCQTSIITGFFFGIDIDPAFSQDERSNKAEVFYGLVPDPNGEKGCDLSKNAIERLVPVTFIHEFQHMISYNQHVLLRGGRPEILWLNEALSHISEEIGGIEMRKMNDEQGFSRFLIGDVFDAYKYLRSPGTAFALPATGTGSLEERGAGWLFLRWLADNFGDGILRELVETRTTGADNVSRVTTEPFSRLLAQWSLANYVSDLPGFTAPDRLSFKTWKFRDTYASLNEQSPSTFEVPFPLVPRAVPGGLFSFQGTLRSGSGEYFLISQTGGQRGFTLRMTNPGGGALNDTLVPRLNVVRIN